MSTEPRMLVAADERSAKLMLIIVVFENNNYFTVTRIRKLPTIYSKFLTNYTFRNWQKRLTISGQ